MAAGGGKLIANNALRASFGHIAVSHYSGTTVNLIIIANLFASHRKDMYVAKEVIQFCNITTMQLWRQVHFGKPGYGEMIMFVSCRIALLSMPGFDYGYRFSFQTVKVDVKSCNLLENMLIA